MLWGAVRRLADSASEPSHRRAFRSISLSLSLSLCIYIYIYIERDIYIYIYTHMGSVRAKDALAQRKWGT